MGRFRVELSGFEPVEIVGIEGDLSPGGWPG